MIGIIGGTGLDQLEGLNITEHRWLETPYGNPSSALSFGNLYGQTLVFLARHGSPNKIAPHLINYRANLSALKQEGVRTVIAVNTVGGIHENLSPAEIAIPDQIIDYTHSRLHTIYDDVPNEAVNYVDFTLPYSSTVRDKLLLSAKSIELPVLASGTYGATQGPRLESSAEIRKFRQDGCDMVGMTGMPEAALAKELGLEYACIALCVNWAAGINESIATMEEIHAAIELGKVKVHSLIKAFLAA